MNSESDEKYLRALERLLVIVRDLGAARALPEVMRVVRSAARELVNADGATFVLREGDQVYYADEDAISPLWKGCRFPMKICISGWVILEKEPAVIPDIYVDPRIPVDAYRPTFVKSLAMVPMRLSNPVGAIGNYWAKVHTVDDSDLRILQFLADMAAGAIENAGFVPIPDPTHPQVILS